MIDKTGGAFYLPLVESGEDEHHSAGGEIDEAQAAAAVVGSGLHGSVGGLAAPTNRHGTLSRSTGALNSSIVQGKLFTSCVGRM